MNSENFLKGVTNFIVAVGGGKCVKFISTLKNNYNGTVDVQPIDGKMGITLTSEAGRISKVYYDLDINKPLIHLGGGKYRETNLNELLR